MRLSSFTGRLIARLPDSISGTLRPPRAFIESLRRGRIPVYLLRGPIDPGGEQGSMIVAGTPELVNYFPQRFF